VPAPLVISSSSCSVYIMASSGSQSHSRIPLDNLPK
jgi:hypothetical protein